MFNTTNNSTGMGTTNPSTNLCVTDNNLLTLGNSNLTSSYIFNPQPMKPKNSKVAIFSVKRNKADNSIKSSKFIKEMWVEVPPNISLDLIVAKEMGEDFNPLTTVIKEIYSITL